MIIGVMITYNDMPHIIDTIESMYDKVDVIIAVDGKFRDFPELYGSDYSVDGTIEHLQSVDKVQLVLQSNLTEVQKRNLYLVGSDGDTYLHLDTDEVWQGSFRAPVDADMVICPLKFNVSPHKKYRIMNRVRVFKHVPGLHYHAKHYWLRDRTNKTFALVDRPGNAYKAEKFNDIKIMHNEEIRDGDRMSAKKKYYKILHKTENRIREEM